MLVLQLITRVTFPSGTPEFTTEFYLFYGDVSVARQLVSCVVFFYFICPLSVSCTECCLCLWIAAYEFWNVYLNVGFVFTGFPLMEKAKSGKLKEYVTCSTSSLNSGMSIVLLWKWDMNMYIFNFLIIVESISSHVVLNVKKHRVNNFDHWSVLRYFFTHTNFNINK
jgi:hypothetical protein